MPALTSKPHYLATNPLRLLSACGPRLKQCLRLRRGLPAPARPYRFCHASACASQWITYSIPISKSPSFLYYWPCKAGSSPGYWGNELRVKIHRKLHVVSLGSSPLKRLPSVPKFSIFAAIIFWVTLSTSLMRLELTASPVHKQRAITSHSVKISVATVVKTDHSRSNNYK